MQQSIVKFYRFVVQTLLDIFNVSWSAHLHLIQ
jgi:hypothetical protein